MGMYDDLRVVNISHDNFKKKHNNLSFQTKDLECEMFEYLVFNGDLYIQAERGGDGNVIRHEKAIKSDFSGEVNIYTDFTQLGVEYWIEYDLIFKDGVLVEVKAHDAKVRKDKRDMSKKYPTTPNDNRTILDEFSSYTQP